jgi:integrase
MARELRRTVETGRDPIDDAKAKARRMTVAQLVERYLAAIETTRRDHKKVRRSIERDVLPVLGDQPAEDVKRRDIISILDAIARRGAPVHANRVRSMLSAMWSWAISEDLIDVEVSPASNIKNRIEERAGTRWLTADEIKRLCPHLECLPEAKRDALKLILLTGQRPGEVVGIRANEIDLDRGIWIIPIRRSKNKRAHTVPLVGEAYEIVARWITDARPEELERHDGRLLLVRARGVRPLLVNNLNWALQSALAEAGIQRAKPHDLRRTTLTHLGSLGIHPLIIGHVANHVSTTRNTVTTAVYVQHDYFDEKRQALITWDTAMVRILRAEYPLVVTNNVLPLRASAMLKPDPKCAECEPEDLVVVEMMGDEQPAAPGEGCDLASIPPTDAYLIELTMRKFRVDPKLPDARQQLARTLRKALRSERPGRRSDGLGLAVAIALSGASPTDKAPAIADKIRQQYQHIARTSLVQKVRRWKRPKRERASG